MSPLAITAKQDILEIIEDHRRQDKVLCFLWELLYNIDYVN